MSLFAMWGVKPKKQETSKKEIKLWHRFVEGLKAYEIDPEEIISGKWTYCGGDNGSHYNYWKICCPNENLPEHSDWCVCGQNIKYNCYITDGTNILIMGNCCIKRFIPVSGRTCERCGAEHKNRSDNKCNDCRKLKLCKDCNNPINSIYKHHTRCKTCFFKYIKN